MKQRCDSWSSFLSDHEQAELRRIVRVLAWQDATKEIATKYGIKPPSKTAYYKWLGRMDPEKQDIELRLKDVEERLDTIAYSVYRLLNLMMDQNDEILGRISNRPTATGSPR